MYIPKIKEILRKASVEVEIQGRKYLALFESDFERVAIELTKNSKPLTDVSGNLPDFLYTREEMIFFAEKYSEQIKNDLGSSGNW